MAVTDEHVAVLRAALTDDMSLFNRLFNQLRDTGAVKGYSALVSGAFLEALVRRFGTVYRPAEVAGFVGDVRSRSERLAERIDPEIAERVIGSIYGTASVQDVDDKTVVGMQVLLLTGLIADEHLDDQQLDTFLAESRKNADKLTS